MTPQARAPRRVSPNALQLLARIPCDQFVTEADLAALPDVTVTEGRIDGLRALRSASAITIRRHDDGHLLYARTPTGTRILEDHPDSHVA